MAIKFVDDPRISRLRSIADVQMGAGFRPNIPQTANPYGYSPWATALGQAASMWAGHRLDKAASAKEQEQRAARGQIARILMEQQQSDRPLLASIDEAPISGVGRIQRARFTAPKVPENLAGILEQAGGHQEEFDVAATKSRAEGQRQFRERQDEKLRGMLASALQGGASESEVKNIVAALDPTEAYKGDMSRRKEQRSLRERKGKLVSIWVDGTERVVTQGKLNSLMKSDPRLFAKGRISLHPPKTEKRPKADEEVKQQILKGGFDSLNDNQRALFEAIYNMKLPSPSEADKPEVNIEKVELKINPMEMIETGSQTFGTIVEGFTEKAAQFLNLPEKVLPKSVADHDVTQAQEKFKSWNNAIRNTFSEVISRGGKVAKWVEDIYENNMLSPTESKIVNYQRLLNLRDIFEKVESQLTEEIKILKETGAKGSKAKIAELEAVRAEARAANKYYVPPRDWIEIKLMSTDEVREWLKRVNEQANARR